MNSASSPTPSSRDTQPVRVWDLPTRLFHWLLLGLVIALIVTGHEGGDWMMWHARCGYAVFTLLLFRLVWGAAGGHHARFAHFLPTPSSLRLALGRGRRGPHQPSVGHNPWGALSVLAMLLVLALQVASGLVSDDEIAFSGPWSAQVSSSWVSLATWYHKAVGKRLLIGLVVLHVLAIVYHRYRHGEHLVNAMVHGDKFLDPVQAAQTPVSRDGWRERGFALLVFMLSGLVVATLVQWGSGT